MKTIIINAVIVEHDKISDGEISFENGVITEISATIKKDSADKIIDAAGYYVLPGGVDPHTMLCIGNDGTINEEACRKNSLAALYGGTTTVIEEIDVNAFNEENKQNSSKTSLHYYHSLMKENSYTDYSFHQAVKSNSKDLELEIDEVLIKNVLDTLPSCYLEMCGTNKLEDSDIIKILREFSRYGATAFIHCESDAPIKLSEELHKRKNRVAPYGIASSRPNYAESEAFLRLCNLSRAGNVAFCADTISTKEVVEILYKQVHEGLPVTSSVQPQHLIYTEDKYKNFSGNAEDAYKFICLPPLRKNDDINALWKGIRDGLVHFVSSKHNATHLAHKLKQANNNIFDCPVGMPGVELRLPLLYTYGVLTNKIDMKKLVEITASHVTRITGLRRKGRIEAGTDADIVIFDPNYKKTIHQANLHDSCDYSPYEGLELQGFPKHVFLRGEHMIENYELSASVAKKGKNCGQLAHRKPIAMV